MYQELIGEGQVKCLVSGIASKLKKIRIEDNHAFVLSIKLEAIKSSKYYR